MADVLCTSERKNHPCEHVEAAFESQVISETWQLLNMVKPGISKMERVVACVANPLINVQIPDGSHGNCLMPHALKLM